MNEKDYLLWLSTVKGIGSKTLNHLLARFKSAENIYYMPDDKLYGAEGINYDVIHNIVKSKKSFNIQKLKDELIKNNVESLCIQDEDYPENLKNIYDPPYILYKKGIIKVEDNNAVAIVGSRKASSYGKWVAYKFSSELAKKGITIVSGMAYGIDAVAHKGAIEHGGRTIAVLGCGLNICYPKANYTLMKEIEAYGALVSEYPIDTQPFPGNFPARNRIISGMAKGIIVIEASSNSGSLITAEFGLEQGREVFAVPGNINSSLSTGTNKLIKDGAKLVTCIEDVLEELDLVIRQTEIQKDIILSDIEAKIYNIIFNKQPIHIELLFKELDLNIDKISSIITILQLKGLIELLPGKILIINK